MRKYSEAGVFVEKRNKFYIVGISEHVLGDVMGIDSINLPDCGEILAGDDLCLLQTANDAFEFTCPLSGIVINVNRELEDSPNLLAEEYDSGWICRIQANDESELSDLYTEERFLSMLEEDSY